MGAYEMKYVKIVFSPTGGTEKAAEMIASEWGEPAETIDLTDKTADFSKCEIRAQDLALIAVPSYGGRVPGLAAGRLAKIKGSGARCVLLCVYGNRAYEDTLLEMADIAEGCGFTVCAAIAAVAEHSIIHQYAHGRPDVEDERQLKALARTIQERCIAGSLGGAVQIPGSRPYKKAGGVGMVPKAGAGCTACGLCAQGCPAGAIPVENPKTADRQKCISCMRCAVRCPQGARKVNGALLSAASLALKKACGQRKEAELFI